MSFGEELQHVDPTTLLAAFDAVVGKLVVTDMPHLPGMITELDAHFPALTALGKKAVEYATIEGSDTGVVFSIAVQTVLYTLSEYALGEAIREQFPDAPTTSD